MIIICSLRFASQEDISINTRDELECRATISGDLADSELNGFPVFMN